MREEEGGVLEVAAGVVEGALAGGGGAGVCVALADAVGEGVRATLAEVGGETAGVDLTARDAAGVCGGRDRMGAVAAGAGVAET